MKNLKNKLKNVKGITLISLVITIIILLILSGISIAQLSENGLFEKAKLAKEVSKNAQEDEEDKIKQYSNEINSYIGANRNFTAVNYSTKEQDTGIKWINGKPIYQITLPFSSSISVKSGSWVSLPVTKPKDAEYIYQGFLFRDCHMGVKYPDSLKFGTNTVDIYITVNDNFETGSFLTIQYTKTTDAATITE